MNTKKLTSQLLVIISILTFVTVFLFVPPIAQNPNYHCFADINFLFKIPNFFNVISNLGFALVGFYGLVLNYLHNLKSKYLQCLSIGFLCTAIGSSYYHYNPNNITLFWDRLPMTIVFITFLAQVYDWYLNKKIASVIWVLGLFIVFLSVWYWKLSEAKNMGDLRLYAIVQFLPILLILIIVSLNYKRQKQFTLNISLIGFCYFTAKLFEQYDVYIFNILKLISGHTLKHIAASFSAYFMIKLYTKK